MNFFLHLSEAGLVNGAYEGYAGEAANYNLTLDDIQAKYPAAAWSGTFVFASQFRISPSQTYEPEVIRNAGQGFSVLGFNGSLQQAIPKFSAQNIEDKIDDGFGYSGKVGAVHGRSWNGSGPWDNYINAAQANNIHSCARNSYVNIVDDQFCQEKARMGFYYRF